MRIFSKNKPPKKRLALVRAALESQFAFLESLGYRGPEFSYENHWAMGDVFSADYYAPTRHLSLQVIGGKGDDPRAMRTNFVSAMLWREPREDVFADSLSVSRYLQLNRPDIAGRIDAIETKDRTFEDVVSGVLPILAEVLREDLHEMVAGRTFEGCIESWS